jgi:hypothetical protein
LPVSSSTEERDVPMELGNYLFWEYRGCLSDHGAASIVAYA